MYLQSAIDNGHKGHPQLTMVELGIKWRRAHPEPMCDAWFFEIDERSIMVPEWVDIIEKPSFFEGDEAKTLIHHKDYRV